MAYARWSDGSDVYVFAMAGGGFTCMECLLDEEGKDFETKTRRLLVWHLEEHRVKGHSVPQEAFDRLWREIEEESKDDV